MADKHHPCHNIFVTEVEAGLGYQYNAAVHMLLKFIPLWVTVVKKAAAHEVTF
jgi:hypothetical protein